MFTARELRDQRAARLNEARMIVESAETENRDLSQEEQVKYDGFIKEAETGDPRCSP